MAYASAALNNANSAKALMDALDTVITGVTGWSFVETWTSSTITANVYKSAAANNSHGSDFYVATYRTADSATAVSFIPFESWDATNKKAIRYAPSSTALTPNATTYAVDDSTGLLLSGNVFRSGSVTTVNSVAFTYYVNVTADRIILGTSISASSAVYVGLYDPLIPGDPFPLAVVLIPGSNSLSSSLGSSTREPFQTASATNNFFVQMWQASTSSLSANASGFGLISASSQNVNLTYTGYSPISRLFFQTSRTAANSGIGARGLLKDCYAAFATGAAGDTITYVVGGTTYTLVRAHAKEFSTDASVFITTT